jgi:repressor LexA
MIDVGILNGDYAIIHPQPMVNDGEIGAVIIDGEATLKKVYIRKDYMELVPANSAMEPIEVQLRNKNVSIVGKLKGIIRKV